MYEDYPLDEERAARETKEARIMSKLSKETHLVMKLVKSRVDLYQANIRANALGVNGIGQLEGSTKVLSILQDIRKEMEGK